MLEVGCVGFRLFQVTKVLQVGYIHKDALQNERINIWFLKESTRQTNSIKLFDKILIHDYGFGRIEPLVHFKDDIIDS